jgi:hypothetical protein
MVQFGRMSAAQEHPSSARAWAAWVWPAVLVVGLLDLVAGLEARSWWLDPAAESSPFSWACALAVLAAAACVTALAMRGRRSARIALAMGLVVIAVDEAFGLHEWLAADLDLRALETLSWRTCALVGYTILLGAVAILLTVEIRSSRRRPTLLIAGLALLVVALGARFGGAALAAIDQLPVGDTRDAGGAAMHALDLMGWSLVAAGLFMLVRDRSS